MNRIKGIKQTRLAEKLKKPKMVNNYTSNRIQPSLEILDQIATILDVSIKDLIVDKIENTIMPRKQITINR